MTNEQSIGNEIDNGGTRPGHVSDVQSNSGTAGNGPVPDEPTPELISTSGLAGVGDNTAVSTATSEPALTFPLKYRTPNFVEWEIDRLDYPGYSATSGELSMTTAENQLYEEFLIELDVLNKIGNPATVRVELPSVSLAEENRERRGIEGPADTEKIEDIVNPDPEIPKNWIKLDNAKVLHKLDYISQEARNHGCSIEHDSYASPNTVYLVVPEGTDASALEPFFETEE